MQGALSVCFVLSSVALSLCDTLCAHALPTDTRDGRHVFGIGTFKGTNGSASCTQCAGGKVSAATAAVFSDTCADCQADTYSAADKSECLACPANTRSDISSDELSDCTCKAGYTGANGQACTACVAGLAWRMAVYTGAVDACCSTASLMCYVLSMAFLLVRSCVYPCT